MCFEWWAFEVLSIEASYLGSQALAAHSIVINLALLLFQIPAGIGVAVTTRVGNNLGAGKAKLAQLSAHVGIGVAAIVSLIIFFIYIYIRSWWGLVYTSDPKLVTLVASILPVVACSQIFDVNQLCR